MILRICGPVLGAKQAIFLFLCVTAWQATAPGKRRSKVNGFQAKRVFGHAWLGSEGEAVGLALVWRKVC